MAVTLLTTGLLCVIAAIVGGGIEAFGGKVLVIQSSKRQIALGLFGILLLLGAYVSSLLSNVPPEAVPKDSNGDATPPPVSRIDRQRARTELAQFISLAKTHRCANSRAITSTYLGALNMKEYSSIRDNN